MQSVEKSLNHSLPAFLMASGGKRGRKEGAAMIYLEPPGTDPYFNLALEEYVFEQMDRSRAYFMLWQNSNTIVVGKYQNTAEEINQAFVDAHGIRVVRRLSGGGAVYHDTGNLNFTFIVDQDTAPGLNFKIFVRPVVEALARFGVHAEFTGRNDLTIDEKLLEDVVTENKEMTDAAKRDLVIALITLKYTQSNSVCYAENGQTIGVGAGQQSRIHCTRLAGQKADNWFLRQCPKVLDLQFVDGIRRADRDNAIDVYIGEEYMDVLADGAWEKIFKVKPEVFTREEKRAWLDQMKGVTLGSDAFFPFSDNIERAHKSGVEYIAEPGGSVRDDAVIECCNKYNMAMAFTGIRLFHH